MSEFSYYVYLLSNKRNSVIYTGVTGDLYGRVLYHKDKVNKDSFTAKYNVNKLVYYEDYNSIEDAIRREKQIKNYSRARKIDLIEKNNKYWRDLSLDWYDGVSRKGK